MKKSIIVLLIAILLIIIGIIYAAYDIYKAITPESLCKNECSSSGCDHQTAFNCTLDKIDGCYYKEYQEIQIGTCNAECLTSDDCNNTYKCINNICVKPTCGDGECDKDAGETCSSCPDDCKIDTGEKCCFGNIVEGTCCSDSDCSALNHEICSDNQCVVGPYCGDETCDNSTGENCDTCKSDCSPSDSQVCCTGVIKDGDCCKDSQCDEGLECKKNVCTVVSSS